MSRQIKIKKGADIHLLGSAFRVVKEVPQKDTFAIKPPDFHGIVPKLILKQGAKVKAGTPLFFSKEDERINFVSPVSGEIVEIVRGERRKIMEVVIKADASNTFEGFDGGDPLSLSREDIVSKMLAGGLWPFVKQRPFNTIANPDETPRSIVVSAFDTSPLAPDYDFILEGKEKEFQAGLNVLYKLGGDKKIFLNIPKLKQVKFSANTQVEYVDETGKALSMPYSQVKNSPDTHPAKKVVNDSIKKYATPSAVFTKAENVELSEFEGPHPAGNVGIQMHHIQPINKGDVIWTVSPQNVAIIGKSFLEGKVDFEKVIALTGSEVADPQYYKTRIGAQIKTFVDGNLTESKEDKRFISGNVLTGSKVSEDGFLGYYDDQITVIPEGNEMDLFGWAVPVQPNKFSLSRTLWSWITPNKEYRLNTNLNGEERAFVVTGEYEKVLPMNIYPVQLLKACLVEDIEAMENLGIYEVDTEDFALCEFGCTSKIPVQQILREGLDLVKKECS